MSLKFLSMFLGVVTLAVGAIFMMQSILSANKSSDLDKSVKFDSLVTTVSRTSKMADGTVVSLKVVNLYAEVVPKEVIALAENVKVLTNKVKVLVSF